MIGHTVYVTPVRDKGWAYGWRWSCGCGRYRFAESERAVRASGLAHQRNPETTNDEHREIEKRVTMEEKAVPNPNERFRKELIQVAAVAVAAIEDMDTGVGADLSLYQPILAEVQQERYLQNHKWGPQHRSPAEWLVILMEEVGEASEAALQDLIFPAEEAAAAEAQ